MRIEIVKESVVFQKTDAIVNAANATMLGGRNYTSSSIGNERCGRREMSKFRRDSMRTRSTSFMRLDRSGMAGMRVKPRS